jgi:hypothetical protein
MLLTWLNYTKMKPFIVIISLLVTMIGQSDNITTTSCPLLPCFFCLPYGNIDFGSKPPCHGCECNPCQYGQPLLNIKCGRGTGRCAQAKSLCKINSADNVYCCPNERTGCCPPETSPIGPCYADCTYDYDCQVGQKYCGNCLRVCQNVTLSWTKALNTFNFVFLLKIFLLFHSSLFVEMYISPWKK